MASLAAAIVIDNEASNWCRGTRAIAGHSPPWVALCTAEVIEVFAIRYCGSLDDRHADGLIKYVGAVAGNTVEILVISSAANYRFNANRSN